MNRNLDEKTVEGFGQEWSTYDQKGLSDDERQTLFDAYFGEFPWHLLPSGAEGFDAGCGSGRWAFLVAPRIGRLNCVDASVDALDVCRGTLSHASNVEFHLTSIDRMPMPSASQDFGYSLGVLHHMPDTAAGVRACAEKLKPGAPFLLYLYYAFDNRPAWFRAVWRASDLIRQILSRSPFGIRHVATVFIAVVIYWPVARLSRLLEGMGLGVETIPLSAYRRRSFYTMRTDALDRFGTRLEKRFTRKEIEAMLVDAGFRDVRFQDRVPFWVALAFRADHDGSDSRTTP